MADSPTSDPVVSRRWPAEWEAHEATLVAWPVARHTWPGLFDRIPRAFARLVHAIADAEPVVVLVASDAARRQAEQWVGCHQRVTLLPISLNDSWIRDYGPLAVWEHDQLILVDFRFDAWGRKYSPWEDDDAVTEKLARHWDLPVERIDMVLEGGALEGNGDRCVVATSRSVWSRAATLAPADAARQYEQLLRRHLGIEHLCWLHHGELVGDDTDGHIDQLARFIARDRMVVASADDPTDANREPLRRMRAELEDWFERHDLAIELVDLPIPRDVTYLGERLPASYCNFLMVEGALLLPTFADRMDERVMGILADLLPDREIVPIPCRELVWGLGAVHCLTQTLPRRPPSLERPAPSTR